MCKTKNLTLMEDRGAIASFSKGANSVFHLVSFKLKYTFLSVLFYSKQHNSVILSHSFIQG